MRVVLVGNTVPPEAAGGLPRHVRELASALARAGCEATVLAKRVDATAPRVERAADGVRIIRYRPPQKRNPLFAAAYPLYAARGVLGALREIPSPDTVIHAHFAVSALPLALRGSPYLYTFHAPVWKELLDERQDTYRLPRRLERPAVGGVRASERLVVSRAQGMFVLSEFMRGQLGELSAGAAARARLVPGGVDVDRFRPDPAVARVQGLLFTARRLTPRTGVDRLIEAMPGILRERPEAELVVAGVGEMEGQLRTLARRLGVGERVRFLGRVSDEALVDWYRRATLVVMPTVKLEGFGLTAAEALACGAPVVGTRVGALPELLEPDLIAPDNTAAALALTIARLLGDPVRLAALAGRGRDRVVPAMGWDVVTGRYLEAYELALSSNRSRPRR